MPFEFRMNDKMSIISSDNVYFVVEKDRIMAYVRNEELFFKDYKHIKPIGHIAEEMLERVKTSYWRFSKKDGHVPAN